MNAADPAWQNSFDALPGESATLEEMLHLDESTIDPEYLADFKTLKQQINAYLKETTDTKEYLLTPQFGIESKRILEENGQT